MLKESSADRREEDRRGQSLCAPPTHTHHYSAPVSMSDLLPFEQAWKSLMNAVSCLLLPEGLSSKEHISI